MHVKRFKDIFVYNINNEFTREIVCNFPGKALPGCRFDGILNTFRCTREDIVDPVDIVIRITVKKNKEEETNSIKFVRFCLNLNKIS